MFEIVESIYLMLGNQSQKEDNEASTRVDMIFNQLDKVIFIIYKTEINYNFLNQNNDNKLSLEEFMQGSKEDPKIVQALSLYDLS